MIQLFLQRVPWIATPCCNATTGSKANMFDLLVSDFVLLTSNHSTQHSLIVSCYWLAVHKSPNSWIWSAICTL
jgi:hypothetical protein